MSEPLTSTFLAGIFFGRLPPTLDSVLPNATASIVLRLTENYDTDVSPRLRIVLTAREFESILSDAAEHLGVSRSELKYKMQDYRSSFIDEREVYGVEAAISVAEREGAIGLNVALYREMVTALVTFEH